MWRARGTQGITRLRARAMLIALSTVSASAAVSARAALAQAGTAVLAGTARDTLGQPITGVEIRISGTDIRARTDDRGLFRIPHAPSGTIAVQARRLGFRMTSTLVVLAPHAVASIDFRMENAGTMLRPVIVRARHGRYTGRLAGFYERLESGLGGYFVTRSDIEEGNPRLLTDILRRVAGLAVLRGTRVRMRGRTCAPLVWLDGIAMPSGEVDLNSFPPSSIEGIELYLTASGAPHRYQGSVDRARCGTILLWSRGPDTEMRRRPSPTPAEEFEQRYAHRHVFTATEVDVAASPDSAVPLAVVYPPELFAGRVGGNVLVELVVDSIGRAEEGTFGVLFSSHPLFARAVQDALQRAIFHAAVLDGHRVAQIVQIPFRFDPPGTDTSQKPD